MRAKSKQRIYSRGYNKLTDVNKRGIHLFFYNAVSISKKKLSCINKKNMN